MYEALHLAFGNIVVNRYLQTQFAGNPDDNRILVCICPIRWQRERHFEPCGHLDIEAFADFMRMLTPSCAILRMLPPTHSVACSDTDYVGPIASRTQSAHRNRE
jgi:hypothetical protein